MNGMKPERYSQLMEDCSLMLTAAEQAEGWHFCRDWDGLLTKLGTVGCSCDIPVCDAGGAL